MTAGNKRQYVMSAAGHQPERRGGMVANRRIWAAKTGVKRQNAAAMSNVWRGESHVARLTSEILSSMAAILTIIWYRTHLSRRRCVVAAKTSTAGENGGGDGAAGKKNMSARRGIWRKGNNGISCRGWRRNAVTVKDGGAGRIGASMWNAGVTTLFTSLYICCVLLIM
jgi:hypothetical protein